jgi:methylase of polypeptide subunit release factors
MEILLKLIHKLIDMIAGKKIIINGEELEVYSGVFEPYFAKESDFLFNLVDLCNCKLVIDVGTGTGILPFVWVKNFPNIEKIIAIDINDNAIENAKRNLKQWINENKVEIIKSDLFEKVDKTCEFDAIIFNGPHIDEENSQDKNRLGNNIYYSLYDPGLETAKRFFNKVKDHLREDGFVLYTFSDYGNIKRLFEIICTENKLVSTFFSVFPFKDRDVQKEPQIGRSNIPFLWYNIKVKLLPQDPLKKVCLFKEIISDFRKTIQNLLQFYSHFNVTKSIFEEYKSRILELLNKCISISLENFLPHDHWIIVGFSLPSWEGELDWEFVYFFAKNIKEEERESFKKKLENFMKELLSLAKEEEIYLIIEFLQKNDDVDEIESLIQDVKSSYFQRYNMLKKDVYVFNNSLLKDFDINSSDNLSFGFEGNDDKKIKIAKNLLLNFQKIENLKYIDFKKTRIVGLPLKGSVYSFSSFLPRENYLLGIFINEIYMLLNEINSSLISMILWNLRQYHALHSAVATIMARNMSHYDSHIEPGLQHRMSTFEEEILKKVGVKDE